MTPPPPGLIKDKNADDEEDSEPTEEELAEQQRKRERLAKVLAGHLKDLPPLSKKVMRIFTSSTFTGNCCIPETQFFTRVSDRTPCKNQGKAFRRVLRFHSESGLKEFRKPKF